MYAFSFPAIHRDGWRFAIAVAAVVLIAAWVLDIDGLAWPGALATVGCLLFFRDPDRVTPTRDGLVTSPADGVVHMIERAPPPPELEMAHGGTCLRISIFLSVLDCHIIRAPEAGVITRQIRRPGTFMDASLDKASERNERVSLLVTTGTGEEIGMAMIAGLVARRIVCGTAGGETVKRGQRIGLIRFGSRADVYLPEGMVPMVIIGQRAIAGETVLADAGSRELPRQGEIS